MTKPCIKCELVKSLDEFAKAKRNSDGRSNECKECRKEYNKKYRVQNKEQLASSQKKRRSGKKIEIQAYNKNYVEANKQYFEDYRANNTEAIACANKLYKASEAGKAVSCRSENRRQLLIRETRDGSITSASLKELYEEQSGYCAICNCDLTQLESKNVHMDHIIPLSTGGKHVLENVQWTCASCNLIKGAKTDKAEGTSLCGTCSR